MSLKQEGIVWHGVVTLVVRDGYTGEIRRTVTVPNLKLSITFPVIGCILFNNPANFALTFNKIGLGSTGGAIACGDTAVSGETASRTAARFSQNANDPSPNLSFSFSNLANTISIAQAGVFGSLTGTGLGVLLLKTSFTVLTVNSQDTLQGTWLQSFASA